MTTTPDPLALDPEVREDMARAAGPGIVARGHTDQTDQPWEDTVARVLVLFSIEGEGVRHPWDDPPVPASAVPAWRHAYRVRARHVLADLRAAGWRSPEQVAALLDLDEKAKAWRSHYDYMDQHLPEDVALAAAVDRLPAGDPAETPTATILPRPVLNFPDETEETTDAQ